LVVVWLEDGLIHASMTSASGGRRMLNSPYTQATKLNRIELLDIAGEKISTKAP
jgi:hypothetical protein